MPVFLALYLPDFRAVAIWNLEAMRLFVGLFWGHNDAFQKPETEFTCINVSYFFLLHCIALVLSLSFARLITWKKLLG